MGSIKRLYLYAASAISLLVLCIGLDNLAAVALGEITDVLGATVIGGASSGREQLSLAIALVVVGAPVFAVHWWLIGRGWRGTDEAASEDRHSAIRAFHMGFVATVSLGVAMYAAVRLLENGLGAILGVGVAEGGGRATDDIVLILVAAPVWWFHVNRRNADLRHDRLQGAASWLTRLYRYGWAFVGLMILLVGASQVIGTLALALIGPPDLAGGFDWWRGPLARAMAAMVAGFCVWWLHVEDARRAIRDAPIIGEDDRSTALRSTYFGAVLLVALATAGLTVARSITALGRQFLGVADVVGVMAFLESVVGPILIAVPFVVAGWLHWQVMRAEAAERGRAPLADATRLGSHLAALVGIVFLTVGVARLGGLLLEGLVGPAGVDAFFREQLAWCIAAILLGAVLWLPSWSVILRRRAADPTSERLATTSRAYLLLVVGGALVAGVPTTVFVLFRVIDTLLGGGGTALGSDLAIPLAVIAVASIVAAYHGRLVVSDLRLAAAQRPMAVAQVIGPQTVGTHAVVVAATSLTLVLRGQAGEDLEAIAAGLREHLPAGILLEAG